MKSQSNNNNDNKNKSELSKQSYQPIPISKITFSEFHKAVNGMVEHSLATIERFPKSQKIYTGMGATIQGLCLDVMLETAQFISFDPRNDRESMARDIAYKLKAVNQLISYAHHRKYVSPSQWEQWVRMVKTAEDMAIGLAMSYQKKREKGEKS